MKQLTGLIDGDYLAYYAVFLNEGNNGSKEDLREMIHSLIKTWCRDAAKALKVDRVRPLLCMSLFRVKNFRHTLYKDYKISRRTRETPEFLPTAYEIINDPELMQGIPVRSQKGFEADDLMGVYHSTLPDSTVIITVDKDLLTVPGRHWNPIKKLLIKTTPKESEHRFHVQWLSGDSTDCIPGLPGIGPAKAEKILKAKGTETDLVLEAYRDRGWSYEYSVTMGQLVRILQANNCGKITPGKPIKFNLWKPTTKVKKWKTPAKRKK